MSGRAVMVGTKVTPEEKAYLKAEAEREGITLGTLLYRRMLNKPDAVRKPGRPPKHAKDQDEGLFRMTG